MLLRVRNLSWWRCFIIKLNLQCIGQNTTISIFRFLFHFIFSGNDYWRVVLRKKKVHCLMHEPTYGFVKISLYCWRREVNKLCGSHTTVGVGHICSLTAIKTRMRVCVLSSFPKKKKKLVMYGNKRKFERGVPSSSSEIGLMSK